MTRGIVIAILIIMATVLVFEMCDNYAGAQDTGAFSQVLSNQKLILEKLNTIEQKLDQLKMRVRL